MRFEFEAAKELWNGRVNHERIKNVDVITNKDARPLGIKAQRAMDFKSHSDETQNIAEENALRQVILSRIYENREKKKECADQCKMNPADGPQKKRAKGEVDLSHTIASNAPGRISMERHSRLRISPSIITLTGPFKRNSIFFAPVRKASGCWM